MFQTEGIRYAGSKRALIPFIHELIEPLSLRSVLDAFSGTTRVSQYFKQSGLTVHANDIAAYSEVFGKCYLLNNEVNPRGMQEKLDYLNNLPPTDGYFTHAYGGDDDGHGNVIASDGKKKPFRLHNTRKLDAIRPEIDKIAHSDNEKSILLTSLILALDKVENTLGHQVAYLSKWAPRTGQTIALEMPRLIPGGAAYTVTSQDALTIREQYDLAYYDPPYNTNNTVTITTRVRYTSYYHIWTTVIKNDQPQLIGAANRRQDASSDKIPGAISPFENTNTSTVERAFVDMISGCKARYVLISYSNKGKITPERLIEIASSFGKLDVNRIDHKENAQRHLTLNRRWLGDQSQNSEYLFLLDKA